MDVNVLNLAKGGKLIHSLVGNIQYGMPPETIKDSSKLPGSVPEYFIIPTRRFDWKEGINFMEFEFPVYYNFFIRKKRKTKLICDFKTMKDVQVIFQETLLGPKDFSRFHRDFWEDYAAVPDMPKELAHFAVNPFEPEQKLRLDMFIEFLIFDESGQVKINKEISVNQQDYEYMKKSGMIRKNHSRSKK
jgi:hypothetical protein